MIAGKSPDVCKRLQVVVSTADYAAIDHGYATTIHKSQGATVDRTFVLASATMDRHLSYVAMTRHRNRATLYAGRDEFKDMNALSARLGRSRAKETTLDYAERRGVESRLFGRIKEATSKAFGAAREKVLKVREQQSPQHQHERSPFRGPHR